jgi:hypothetical protein
MCSLAAGGCGRRCWRDRRARSRIHSRRIREQLRGRAIGRCACEARRRRAEKRAGPFTGVGGCSASRCVRFVRRRGASASGRDAPNRCRARSPGLCGGECGRADRWRSGQDTRRRASCVGPTPSGMARGAGKPRLQRPQPSTSIGCIRWLIYSFERCSIRR